jgi:hypothetical protein
MFSASPSDRRHEDQRRGLPGEDRDQDHLTGQLMSGMVSAGSSTVMTLSTRPMTLAMLAGGDGADAIGRGRQLFLQQRRDSGHFDIGAMGQQESLGVLRSPSDCQTVPDLSYGVKHEPAELKLLNRSPWRAMLMIERLDKTKTGSQNLPEPYRIVTLHRKPAAFFRTLQ